MLVLDIAGGRIQAINSVVNPDKLRHVGTPADLRAFLRRSQGRLAHVRNPHQPSSQN